MSETSRVRFGVLYAALSVLTILGDTVPILLLLYGCKPLLMGTLMAYLYVHKGVGFSRSLRWIFIGLILALAGDVFLMIREVDLFAPGLASFLVMQVCYLVAFRQSIRESGKVLSFRQMALTALPFVIYLSVFLFLLYAPLKQNPATAPLWIPVVIYVLCISAMAWMAMLRRRAVTEAGYRKVAVGVLLFMVSDSLIAIDKFIQPVPASALLILGTYAAAQYGIVMGMLRQSRSQHKPVATVP